MTDKQSRGQPHDPAKFIAQNLRLEPVSAVPEISLYTAHSASGLWRLTGRDGPPPYWAYRWAGGTVLARYLIDHPDAVRGKRVLDLGAGSGIVGIAAAMRGAASVVAAEVDPNGIAALKLNAAANGVAITPIGDDLLDGLPPHVELVAVGDLFYEAALAVRVAGFLDRCLAAGIACLVGDPGRAPLPLHRLERIAEYDVPDFGGGHGGLSRVYRFVADPARPG
ncbi:class I SAM-dependent methyltransferase [Devosia sp.]|uniref:class I SAM-dependent methyltransferase n=1 Tax=Devosia sp. TaxID=1871048 RepID=UPI003BAC015D